MISRGEVKFHLLGLLNKSSVNKGFYSDDKMNLAIKESMDFITTESFLADDGWANKIRTFTVPDGELFQVLPGDMNLINAVRFLQGDSYEWSNYDPMYEKSQTSPSGSTTEYSHSHRFVDNAIYFNPPLRGGETNNLQIEFTCFPPKLKSDSQSLPQNFNEAFTWFLIFRSAVLLSELAGQTVTKWESKEGQWYKKMMDIMHKRSNTRHTMREFPG